MDRYLIKRDEIDRMEGLAKQHFLNPDARRLNKSLGDLTGLQNFGFHLIEVPPGHDSTELHLHHFEDECVYVLEGTGRAVLGDDEHEIGPGDFIGYRAGGLAHALRNTGDGVLKCIVVGARLAHDVGEYPRLQKRLYRNEGYPWDVVDTAAIANPGGSAGKKA